MQFCPSGFFSTVRPTHSNAPSLAEGPYCAAIRPVARIHETAVVLSVLDRLLLLQIQARRCVSFATLS
jgi:hypothetical protein